MTPVVRGDWWDGIPAITITVNDEPPSVPLASARLQFRKTVTNSVIGHELSSADGGIVIEDAVTWEMSIPGQVLPLTAGDWPWDLQTTDTDGHVKTYVAGTLTIIQDVTR